MANRKNTLGNCVCRNYQGIHNTEQRQGKHTQPPTDSSALWRPQQVNPSPAPRADAELGERTFVLLCSHPRDTPHLKGITRQATRKSAMARDMMNM